MKLLRVWQCLLCAALFSGLLSAQMTITGTLSGRVIDPSGQAMPGAKITITSPTTSESRSSVTGEDGTFNMIAVQPETYNLRIEQRGFEAYERRGVVISANERVSLGDVPLQIGEVTETISVEAEVARV